MDRTSIEGKHEPGLNTSHRSSEYQNDYRERLQIETQKIIVLGGGVAGSEVGTYLSQTANIPLEVIEIEVEPSRRFGGWAFQSFPNSETTNLALRKMYLGEDAQEIHDWIAIPGIRESWPQEFHDFKFHKDQPLPRALVQHYIRWRRANAKNELVSFTPVTGEGVKVTVNDDRTVEVQLRDGRCVTGNRLVMASGSISVKIPPYLKQFANHDHVIVDPLTKEGDAARAQIPKNASTLILGTGLTGEEQVSVLRKFGHSNLSLLSRSGKRHYSYPEEQTNLPLVLSEPPDFLKADTPEEFNQLFSTFLEAHLQTGHTHEDIFAALRPHWNNMRAELGGCKNTADRIFDFRRELATQSIGAPWEVSQITQAAEEAGILTIAHGYIQKISWQNNQFQVSYSQEKDGPVTDIKYYQYIINAVGRNIIRHDIWHSLLQDGLAQKHAGIGVQVGEFGELRDKQGSYSDLIYVVGMPRAGDHTLRHGFLGNTAFNVPMLRKHVYSSIGTMLDRLTEEVHLKYLQ